MIHGRSTYLKYKCRCDICCQDAKRYKRERKLKLGGDTDIRLDATPLINRLIADGQLALVPRGAVRGWRERGMSVYLADKWCIKLGYHPYTIFGQAFYEGAA